MLVKQIIREHSQCVPFTYLRQEYTLYLFYIYELTAPHRDEEFLSRFHQGEASFSRTQVCKIVRVCIQMKFVAHAAAVGES